jgi:predicted O-methyltransferase YrrM
VTDDSSFLNAQSLKYAEDFVLTPDAVRDARAMAANVNSPEPSEGVCELLSFLARLLGAKAVVEVGTGTGVTGLALFGGMGADGELTSIDEDADWQLEAREAFTKAGISSRRFRLIAGDALDIMPRLRDEAYDLVFINGDKLEYVEYVAQALRMLRPGGLLLLNDALWHNLVADPHNEDDETVIIREALEAVQAEEHLSSVLLPVGDGLLAAIKLRIY